jgi:hypothetical protein
MGDVRELYKLAIPSPSASEVLEAVEDEAGFIEAEKDELALSSAGPAPIVW